MSEEIMTLFDPDKRWRLSGHDADIINDLQEVIRWWLPALTETDDLAAAVDMLQDLDGIVAGRPPSLSAEFTVSRIDPTRGGFSVSIILSSDTIWLSCDEWVPNVNGTLDSGPIYASDGQPMHFCLDTMGSYDREHFDEWWHQALDTGPQEPRDQNVKGQIEITA